MRGKNFNNMEGRGKLKRGHVLGGMPYPLNKKRKREGGREDVSGCSIPCTRVTCFIYLVYWALYYVNGESPIGLQISYMGRI